MMIVKRLVFWGRVGHNAAVGPVTHKDPEKLESEDLTVDLTFEVPGLPPTAERPITEKGPEADKLVRVLNKQAREALRGRSTSLFESDVLGLEVTAYAPSPEECGSGAACLNAIAWALAAPEYESESRGPLISHPSQIRRAIFSWKPSARAHCRIRLWVLEFSELLDLLK